MAPHARKPRHKQMTDQHPSENVDASWGDGRHQHQTPNVLSPVGVAGQPDHRTSTDLTDFCCERLIWSLLDNLLYATNFESSTRPYASSFFCGVCLRNNCKYIFSNGLRVAASTAAVLSQAPCPTVPSVQPSSPMLYQLQRVHRASVPQPNAEFLRTSIPLLRGHTGLQGHLGFHDGERFLFSTFWTVLSRNQIGNQILNIKV